MTVQICLLEREKKTRLKRFHSRSCLSHCFNDVFISWKLKRNETEALHIVSKIIVRMNDDRRPMNDRSEVLQDPFETDLSVEHRRRNVHQEDHLVVIWFIMK